MSVSRTNDCVMSVKLGICETNEEGERVTDFAMAFDVCIVNTFFENRTSHLVTYKIGGR